MAKKKNNKSENIITHKTCKRCGEELPLDDFKINYGSKDGTNRGYICINCINNKANNTRNNKTIKDYYIYRFLNEKNEVIYVGKTTNLNRRIEAHKHSSLSNIPLFDFEVFNIEYAKFKSEYKSSIYEIHYIVKYKPI